MMQRKHPGEAMTGEPGALPGEAIRILTLIVAPHTTDAGHARRDKMPMDRCAAFFAIGDYLGAAFGTELGDGPGKCFDVGRDDMAAQADRRCCVPTLSTVTTHTTA